MPMEMKLWRLGGGDRPQAVAASSLAEEKRLENVLEHEVELLGLDVMIIGRQVLTAYGKVIDLLALNADGEDWTFPADGSTNDLAELLNTWGARGWELACTQAVVVNHDPMAGGGSWSRNPGKEAPTGPESAE